MDLYTGDYAVSESGIPSIQGGSPNLRPEAANCLRILVQFRVAEALLWVAQGKTNADIATILGISESTVKKHLLEIFQVLGVETRSAATLRALEVLSSPSSSSSSSSSSSRGTGTLTGARTARPSPVQCRSLELSGW